MKRLFTILLLLLSVLSLSAEELELGYGFQMDRGCGDVNSVVTPYVLFPPERLAPMQGSQLTRVVIGLREKAANLYLYIKAHPTDDTPLYRQKVGDLAAGWHQIVLDQPFDIVSSDTLCIGYKTTFRSAEGAGYDRYNSGLGSLYYNNAKTRWDHIDGSFCIRAVLSGDALPQYDLAMLALSDAVKPLDLPYTPVLAVVEGRGLQPISGYQLAFSIDGGEEQLCDFSEHIVACNARDSVWLSIPEAGIGQHKLQVCIHSLAQGSDCYAPNDTMCSTFTERDASMVRRIVVEEATGEWCGWCPRGLVGLEMMKERYPSQFIAISCHQGDELQSDDYLPFFNQVESFPSCIVDRRQTGDPYFDIERLFQSEAAADNRMGFDVSATLSEENLTVQTHSTIWSSEDIPALNLSLAFVVTEDGVVGQYQKNSYSGAEGIEMGGWESLPSIVPNPVFNDVARGIAPSYEGTPCFSGMLVSGDRQEFDYQFPLPAAVQHTNQIHVIALLIDHQNGSIVNACSVVPSASSDISHIVIDQSSAIRRFDLWGRPLPVGSRPQGIVIVR